jgi:hypothetical protein
MRIMVGLVLGVIIGYVAFAPDMVSMRQQISSKFTEMVGSK